MRTKPIGRWRCHRRIRKRVVGTPERLRLVVFRSLKHIYAQVIDDVTATTVVSASTLEPAARAGATACGGAVEAAKAVGQRVAELARAKGVAKVVFDRGGYRYHGRVRAVADGARAGGLDV